MAGVRRTRNWILAVAAVGVLGGAGLVGAGMMDDDGGDTKAVAGTFEGAAAPAARTVAPAPTKTTPPGPTAAELAAAERAKRVKALDAALKKYAATAPEFSVAVLDRRTGQRYSYRGTEKYETASVVKVQVLACLLLTAQDAGRDLTSTELALAKRMIRLSDNDATTSLFSKLGRAPAVGACNKRLGLTQTKVSGSWGLTRTTVDDQVRLLGELVDTKGPLDADSRKLAYTLMSTVDTSQDWGVPAAARTGEKFTVKNGWLARSTENYRWIINTVGRVTGGDTDVSIAVLSHDNATMSGGITVVEKVAKLTRQYLKY
ncbi:Beta-lactamase enzyme family protein [Paractinoplanes atraurantiacus]|uniref:Beta-lactamase enzyme family protein n=1 Tax=Paractinoplanes atraurantiacus TaxID=1036182 RepID=A0A285JDG9_9ACTN|nr:Beta-lactamase enzyme family protein [Actinoplanes atraurantiacus]